jgi:hypothetical protein
MNARDASADDPCTRREIDMKPPMNAAKADMLAAGAICVHLLLL